MLGVFAAGRILNAKTARSKLIGGMVWGVSAVLHGEAIIDSPAYIAGTPSHPIAQAAPTRSSAACDLTVAL